MSFATEHKRKIEELNYFFKNQTELKLKANGGNSLLFAYPPKEEKYYLKFLKEAFSEQAVFIDCAKLFTQFIDETGVEDSIMLYKEFGSQFFKDDESDDLTYFDMIIQAIVDEGNNDKIPFLIRTGTLYGTGIDNVSIIEHKDIMNLNNPLVVCYPAIKNDDQIMFLGVKPSSKYRCHLIY